ncbi:hypothetical protein Anas_08333 [Armadillidium nasatum]|uniref:Smoothelin domain-containing protein n=1 Tax=Armadillidium nasatum TaxID=96803 RepID=A0A5N5TGS3_9CRUS|nr:hypothetical protein Anas_08333 [Armadillidium nasatum]
MSWVTSRPGGGGGRGTDMSSVPPDLDEITDEEFLKQLWQQAEDFSDRRRIRARMYKLREKRLREMVQNDEESLGALTMTDEGDSSYHTETHTSAAQTTERKSSVEIKLDYKGDSSVSESSRIGQLSMRGVGTTKDDDIIENRIKEVSKGRGARYQQVLNKYDEQNENSTSRSNYSVQSNALTGDSYQSIKHKEVRDSVSPVRGAFDRRIIGEESETTFTSDEEVAIKSESESVSSRNTSRDDKSVKSTTSSRKVTERKLSKELNINTSKKAEKSSPTSPSRKVPGDTSPSKATTKRQAATPGENQSSILTKVKTDKRTNQSTSANRLSSGRKKVNEKSTKMGKEINGDYKNLHDYLNENVDSDDEIIKEEEEEGEDEEGHTVKMIVQTRKKKDGTQIISRRLARAMKIVEKESDIDEILVGNPDHEVLERNVEEKEEKDGSKIKIITETRRRPDGIEYTTKNVLKTSKIFDYDHPEDIAYSEHDELISSEESTETDENGITIKTVTETRRKKDGVEYTTKKVYKTFKVDATITPSDDDEVLDRKETDEEQSDGTILRIIIEKRRTKDGQEYTHRQVYRSRKLTLSGIDVLKGTPSVDNDDEVIDRKEKEELDENRTKIKIVTETRRRKDGSTYSFEYILRSFKGTENDIEKMSIEAASNSSNINVSDNDKIIKEDVKEELQKDGSIVRTIIERRRAKDGTEYLRHRIMKIPKLPEPELVVGSLDDEVIEEDVKEKVLADGTHCKAITERRRSSTTGVHYTLRRMSKVFHHQSHLAQTDEIIDENVTEEETGNGILVKTVIRRYERPDGSVYTTHDIQKSYNSPVAVNVDEYEYDELIDRSYDERETLDGYIIKTIIETRCRNDGTHYTIERTEKVSKLGEGIEVSFKGNSISSGSPGDTVVSCEEHEEPSDDGALVKTILEVRRRPDGTEYTNKITIRSTEVLVPEHETSYVIIKADSKDGDGECSFFPSLEDEIVYVRKKQDVDEKGNQITIVIETRKSKTTGEKYNLTKKIHTTDVVMTDKGEKILTKKPQREGTLTRKRKSIEKVDTKKTNRISSFEKDKSKVVPSSVTVNLVTKKATVKEATKSSPLKPTTVRKSPKSGSESEPSMSNSIKKPIKRYPSGDNKIQERSNRKPVQDAKKTSSYTIKQKVTQSNSLPVTKSKVVRKPLPTKKYGSPSDSSPEQISENDSSGKESPRRESKPRSEPSPKVKSPVTRVSSSPARGRSPHRSGTSTPREGTPVRQCCKKSEPETPSPKQKSYVPIVRKKPESKDAPNVNGDLKKQPRKIQPDNSFKFEKSPPRDSPTKSQRPRSPEKSYTPKVLPEKSYKDSNTFKKPVESKKASPPNELSFEKEPIISLPQTPLTEEMKAYPATSSSTPYIEDVSTEPDLPYHTVHRPSLVREPSEYNPDILNDESLDTSAPKTTKTREPKSSFETKIDKKSSDSSAYSSSEDESRRFPSKRKDSPFKPFPTTSKKPFSEERKPKPIIEKTREEAPKSLLDQIIPDGSEETSDIETDREKKIEMKNSFSAKLSMFERSKPDSKEIKTSYKPEKKQPQTEKLVPVKEPIIVPKYIHPLGSDSESDQDKPKKTTKEDINLSSTRLVMSAIGSENLQSKTTREYESTDREKQDIVTSLRERSKSPFSKDSSSLPRSKEGSPAPFVKEDSPGRFLTGKPIDQGPNTTKIKRLERSNSNKKIIYEDLEENAANLPSYLKDIEYITDVSVLEKLLQKAETYEERRIIRGHIRSLKKVDSNLTKTSTPNYKRFIESKPSPTSSPILSRRTTTTETTSYTKSGPSKKPDPKGDTRSPQLSPTEESKSFRSFQSKDRRYKKRSTDESESDRRSSVEEIKYERKSSSEIIERSEVTSSLTDRSREWKYKPTETTVKKSTELFSTTKVRKESPEGRIPSDRTSSPEDSKRVTSSSLYSDKYRKLSDDISKGRKISDDDLTRKTSRDNTVRKISSEETTRKKSREETTRKTSTEILRKTSHEETIRRSSRDDTIRKTSRDDTVKKSPRDDTFRKTTRDVTTRKTSQDDTVRKTSRTDKERKSSQDDTTKKITNKFSREPKSRETPKDTSREYPRKSSREDSYRKSSPESYERNRTSSPDTPKSSRKSSPDTKVIRRTSPDRKLKEVVPKSDTRQPKPYETSVTRKTSDDLETSVKSTSYLSKSDTRSDSVSKRYTKTSAELDINRQPQETKEKPDTKPVSRSPFLTRKQKETPKETTESHVYMEPLRHQRLGTTVKSKVEQTNVDKIVSPYGVGPTDEYGLPLIGLKALKRRNQQPIEEPVAPKPEKPEEEFVPCDAQGRPLFGLRALRKAPETTTFTTTQVAKESTAVQETLHNAFVSTETSHLQSGVITQPETHTTEVVSTTIKNETTTTGPLEESCPTYSSSDDSHQHNTVERRQKRTRRKDLSSFGGSAANPVSSEDEENLKDHSNKTRRVTNRFLKRDLSSELSSESEGIRALSTPGETSPSLVKSVDMSLRRKPSLTGSDIVSEQTEPKDSASTPLKPKKKLRDTFEPTSEQVTDSRPHRTWDLETDLSTRSQVMENIIAKHETLTKQETAKPAKKLNGILKKTSTSSIQTSKIISSDSEGFESSERTEIFERKSSKDRSPSPSKVEDRDEFSKDRTNDVERKTSYTEIRLSKPTEDGDESKPLRIIKGQKSAEVKIFATERKDKTDKTDERPERRKTSETISKTTTRKENVTGEPKKTVHKKSISEEKPLISPGDKLPAISNDLFKVDDRKGKITSNETKLSTTEKLEEKTQRKSKSVIDTTKDKKSPQIIKERDVSPKVGKKETKTKPLGDSIEKDSIDGDSSSESSSDESSSSQSSVDSQRKIKPSKPTKSPSDKKDSLERKKVPKKPKDSRREERHSTTRKKSNKETELVIEDAVSRDFSSSSSPERSTTRRAQKPSDKSLRDDKDRETARTTSRSVVKTHSPKEELSDRERKKSYDKLVKVTSKTEDTRNLFTENRRKSSETKPSKFVSPERENKVHKKSKTPEPVPTDLHVKKLPTTDKPSRKTTLIEKHIFNDDSKQRINTYKRKTYNEDKKVFGSPKKETHVSRNRTDSKKSVNANLKDSPEVVRDKTRLSPKYKKAKISDIKESDKKFTRKEYDSNLGEFKKSPRDKPKVKEFSITEKTVKVRKEEGKHFDKDREIKRKSSTTEHSKAKRKLSKEFDDVKSDDTDETKDKTTPFTKSSPLKPRTKGKEFAPKIKTYETDKLLGKENITKKVTNETLNIRKSTVKNDKRNLETSDLGFTREKISSLKERKDDSKTKGAKFSSKSIDQSKIKDSSDSSESETVKERVKTVNKYSSDEEYASKRKSSVSSTSEEKIKTYKTDSDQCINEVSKFADTKKEELQKRRVDRTESEKKIEMNKIRKETDIIEVSEIEDKTQLKPKRSIDLIRETKVTKKSYDTETNLVSKSKRADDEDIIQVKKPKGQESRPQIIPEKRTEVPLDEREKDKVSKSPELDKTRTQVKPHKTTDSYNRDVVKTTKEEISRHSNKQDKKHESIISDVQESKTKPKQNIRGDEKVVDKDELKMTVDSDVEIKTTSDSDMSVDAKKIYKKKTEISDKVSDNEKVDKQSDIKRTEKSKVNYQTIRDAKLATKHTENEDVKEEKVRKTSQNIKTTRVLEKDKEFLKDETELYKEVRPKKYNDVFCTVDGRIIDKSPLPDKGTPKIRPDPKQKTKSDQKQVDEDELNINIKTDFDIEIKTTSDSDVSADTKQLYKKETEISGKKSDIGKIDKQSDVKRTEKLRVSSQTMIEDKTASKITEIKDENEEKVRKTSQNIKTSTVSEVKNKFLKDETDIDKKAKPKKSLEKKDVFCTVDGRIIDKQPLPAKGTPKLRPDSEQDTRNDQTQTENDRLNIRDDIDVEIKTTSDTDVSVDTKHIYKTEIETSDKERDIGKVDETAKSKVSSQTIIEENTATKFSENKDVKEEKVRKTSQNIKTSRVSEKKKEPLQDETDVSKKARTRKSVEKNHLFCTVDGRIIDKQSVPAKETPKIRSDTDVSRRKKSSPSSENIPHDTNKIDTKKESKHQIASKVPKNSPVSRLSKSPEPEDISRRLRKLSKQRKTSSENIDDSNKRKNSDSRTCSLQSLSVASTTSSVPGYMRPRRDSKSYKRHTPERDLQEVEDLLLNSYQYTRCTKRVVKPPVKYDYTYVINTNEGAAGGKDSYSIYFGPREKVPLLKNNAPETIVYGDTYVRHSRDESNASSRKTSIDNVASSQKNVQEIVTESDRVSSDKKSDEDKYLDIKLQYENKIKAIDLKHSSPRDDSPPYQRKESDSRYNEDIHKNFENKGTFSDIRQQYKDTVRSIAEDSFRKSSYTSESKSKEHIEHSKPDIEDPSLLKYKELASKDYKDYGIEKKQQSTLYSVTDLRNLSKKDNLVTSSSYDNRDVQGLQTEVQTKVVEDDQRSRDSSTVIRDKTSALSESKEFEKQSRESHVKESLSTGNDTINFDRTTTLKNIKFLPDYDYNKIYASKTSKPSTDSQQVFSSDEQYSNSKANVSQTMKTDSSTYVTFDGRTVTTSDRKAFDQSDSTGAFNKMADDKHGKVGQSDLRSSQFVQQDDNIQLKQFGIFDYFITSQLILISGAGKLEQDLACLFTWRDKLRINPYYASSNTLKD